jgi:hypothetical protein
VPQDQPALPPEQQEGQGREPRGQAARHQHAPAVEAVHQRARDQRADGERDDAEEEQQRERLRVARLLVHPHAEAEAGEAGGRERDDQAAPRDPEGGHAGEAVLHTSYRTRIASVVRRIATWIEPQRPVVRVSALQRPQYGSD